MYKKHQDEDGKIKANIILNELRNNVITSLHQTGKSGEAKDGMDLAMCIIDQKERKIQFSWANNPLYFVRSLDKPNHSSISICLDFCEAIK